ncbi:MAG: biopolymer transporter ExbD [Candidatus Eisenbacteria bacterium]
MARHRIRKMRDLVEADLEIMPLMNLFVVLIPMLLLSAVFLELSVIHMAAPGGDAAEKEAKESLDLAVHITEGAYRVEGNGIESREFSRRDRSDSGASSELAAYLQTVAADYPENHAVRIVSQPTTHYDEIIEVMDRSREAGLPEASLQGAD